MGPKRRDYISRLKKGNSVIIPPVLNKQNNNSIIRPKEAKKRTNYWMRRSSTINLSNKIKGVSLESQNNAAIQAR